MPTLFTALKARHGTVPPPRRPEGKVLPEPAFSSEMLSEIVGQAPQPANPQLSVIVVGAGFAGLSAAYDAVGFIGPNGISVAYAASVEESRVTTIGIQYGTKSSLGADRSDDH
jgi:hypothetical protein